MKIEQRLVIVRWRDAHGIKSEESHADVLLAHRPAIYYSAGILVHSDERGVTIAQDLGIPLGEGDETTYRTRTFVPRELVDFEIDAGKAIRQPKKKRVVTTDVRPQEVLAHE